MKPISSRSTPPPQPRRDDLVDAGRHEPGAACDHQMRDAIEPSLFAQRGDGRQRKLWRGFGIERHARFGAGKGVRGVEAVGRDRRSARQRGRQNRPAMPDAAAPRHAFEQHRVAAIGQAASGPADKRFVDVVTGDRARDGVDTGLNRRHIASHA
jgi:hypothetical protein